MPLDAMTGLDSAGATTKVVARVATAGRNTTVRAPDTTAVGNRDTRVVGNRAKRAPSVRDKTRKAILGTTRTAILGKRPGAVARIRAGLTRVIRSSARLVSRAWAAEWVTARALWRAEDWRFGALRLLGVYPRRRDSQAATSVCARAAVLADRGEHGRDSCACGRAA
jgi:hypothetical protein